MATFGKIETHIDPSEAGKDFPVKTHVMFTIRGKSQTGIITKQLKNAAVVEIDEKQDNEHLMIHSNGVVVINYKQMKKI
ncbi:hypothetical protein P7H00_12445 [Enterococcus pseudoavium]|uniref:DUF2187 domain-containing protein n=1 Tax=Enterococcus pseudoavium TaxID=44007 RepID=A0AAE4I1M0_9ENTE|nr:hypothetical protein [Enterococcus pseudoavium]MDT2737920.1 hypothetical protein [Enterococcus pseudoavium]MDT2753300.1 hypothetical protein [Enterococcus pseudoavium]MDT2770537.1 hypothetical protein [Enterococcus pseudoavium]REC32173.1 hypothetical protein CF160_06830 [Enterococcus pseudoavium]